MVQIIKIAVKMQNLPVEVTNVQTITKTVLRE